jgi:hypothetical protein
VHATLSNIPLAEEKPAFSPMTQKAGGNKRASSKTPQSPEGGKLVSPSYRTSPKTGLVFLTYAPLVSCKTSEEAR